MKDRPPDPGPEGGERDYQPVPIFWRWLPR
jgi:hypothetical protein